MTGGASNAQRGASYERNLVNALRQSGRGALRFPASGAATTRSVPDIVAANPVEDLTELWGVELKSGKGTTLYVGGGEVMKLKLWGQRWGSDIYLGARFTSQASPTHHYLVAPEDARRTESGRYGLPIDDIDERASVVVRESGEVAYL